MFRITETQLGMFVEWNGNRRSLQYNVTGCCRLPADTDGARLEEAVCATIAAHPVFHTRFVERDGTVLQDFDATAEIPFAHMSLPDEDAVRRRAATFARPFDLLGGELLRFELIATPTAKCLLFDICHVVFDGTTMSLFFNEIGARYDGRLVVAEEATYAEFAADEEASFASPLYAEAAADHKARFAGVAATLPEDPAADGRGPADAYETFVATSYVDRALVDGCCQTLGVAPNLFFLGVVARVLGVFANERRVSFMTVNHGRRNAAFRHTHGACVKMVPVLGELRGDLPLAEYFRSFRLHRAGVYPFTHAVRDIGLKPGFLFVNQVGTVELTLPLGGASCPIVMARPGGESELPSLMLFEEERDGAPQYKCYLSCVPGRYTQSFLDRFVALVASTARNFAAHPDACLGAIPTLDESAQAELLALSRGGDLAYDATKTVVDLVAERAAQAPDRTAAVDCETSVTYGELDRGAEVLAAVLREQGVVAGGFVGLMLPRRVSFPLAALAVQKCGAGYVPIDAEYPADRIAYMLTDSGAPVLITTRALFTGKTLDFTGRVLFYEDEMGEKVKGEKVNGEKVNGERVKGSPPPFHPFTPSPVHPSSPAYMIYTSGSTGRPKGAVMSHRGLAALCAWVERVFELGQGCRVATHPSFSFDASVIDIFPALASGAELHVFSEEIRKDLPAMRDYIAAHGITGGTMSTQIGMAMVNAFPDMPLRYLLFGGEKLLPMAKTAIRIVNGYGPTEFCVCSSFHTVDQAASGDIPIGRPVPNSYSFICDPFGQLVPRGMTGELCLAGAQIADGYWHNPEKTAAAFIPAPFPLPQLSTFNFQLSTLYRTGDFARYNDAGLLEYKGRIDFQVKLRGFRIEIGEIEHAAATCSDVETVIALVREIAGTQHLVLYYTGAAAADAVKAKMSETLTDYMVPDFFVRLDAMPMTPVGKIDHKALPAPELSDEPAEPPANDREAQILKIVQTILKTDHFGVTHDFNRLGLTSLGAMTLIAQLRAQVGLAVTMRQLVERPTVRAVAALGGETLGQTPQAPASRKRRPKRSSYPMSENQRGIYADWLRNPQATQYNVPAAIRFPGMDAAKLAAAAERVLDAHPAFKARFAEKNGEIVQLRCDETKVAIVVQTVAEEPDAAFLSGAMRPFAPQDAALVRATVFASPTSAYLFLDTHHTVFDGCSMGVFLADLVRVLEGGAPKGEQTTAFDAALEERDYLESELLAEDDAWFGKYLDGCESTHVETSASGADGVPGQCGRVTVRTAGAAIAQRCRELGVSPSDWFLTAFMELLRRVGRSDDVQIAFVSAGRADPEVADTVGMFVRTMPVRNIRDAKTFSDAARRLRNDVRDIIDRDRYSYVRACEKFGLRPEIIFAFEGGLFDLPLGAEIVSPPNGTAKCPLSVLVTPGKGDFELAFEYDASLYSQRDMSALLGMFATLAQGATAADELRAIPLVTDEEARQIVSVSSGVPIAYDDGKTFVDLLHAASITRAFATAVVDCEASLTYGELDAQSDALAAVLRESGVVPGGFVGLMLPRRLSFVVSLVGVQKCGAGYVPIDAEYPADRIAYMLADSGAPVLITTRALFTGKALDFTGRVLFYEDEMGEKVNGEKVKGEMVKGSPSPIHPFTLSPFHPFTLSPLHPSTPAYMIYTSGSTGRPKGVVLSHRALRHLCAWVPQAYGIDYNSRIASHPSFSFDASVIDIFPALASGAELHIFSEEVRKDLPAMHDYIVAHGITGATMSTQIGMALVDAYPDMPLKYLQLGGEKLLPTAQTAVRIINGYGPTEFCVCSSFHVVDQSVKGDIPIGRAVPGTASFIVDRYGHLLPQGFAGEIALAGPQLAEGYWHNPEKTAAVFTPIPFSLPQTPQTPQTLYRTGDLARYNAAGEIEYLGRIDFQVKLRGFRIEIGEIEHAAAQYPGVGAVAAEVREVAGTKHLVLYYAGEGTIDEAALKAQMAASLAAYMVPDYFVRLDAMPMTPNGKINRKALPVPSAAPAEAFVEPRAGAEADIAAAYAETLGLDRFSATADFFLSGGTSLLGIKAVVALQKRGLDAQYGDLFKYKTPRALAAFLAGEATAETPSGKPGFDYGAYDYAKIDALLAATRNDLFDGFKVHSLGDVLLTGATGYLGVHVLRYLLEKTSSSVVALIRPKRNTSPERRLDAQFVYYFGERLPRSLRDRITFVEGDITDADLADKLADVSVGTVINCAAMVKHYVADDAMDRVNVGGVENLIRWCEQSRARLVHTSTYSVGGTVNATSPAVLSERALFVGQDSDNDYIRTKFLAERAVLAAVADGRLRGKVMRLGNLMGRESDGEFQMNVGANAFVNALKSYKAIGAFPLEELAGRIEMSPIDRVAEAVCLLATTPDDMVVFHPFNAYALDMGAVLGAMVRRGCDVAWVSRAEFAAHVEALRNDAARAKDLQGVLHYAQRHLDNAKTTPVVNAWTTTVLYRLGFRWRPADDRYLANFFDMLDGLAVFG